VGKIGWIDPKMKIIELKLTSMDEDGDQGRTYKKQSDLCRHLHRRIRIPLRHCPMLCVKAQHHCNLLMSSMRSLCIHHLIVISTTDYFFGANHRLLLGLCWNIKNGGLCDCLQSHNNVQEIVKDEYLINAREIQKCSLIM
jgi:hypothetical protein